MIHRKVAELLLAFDYLLLHSTAVAVDGEAFLFVAPSGTGKSTHTALWRGHFGQRAVMVNDDKPFLNIPWHSDWGHIHLPDMNIKELKG